MLHYQRKEAGLYVTEHIVIRRQRGTYHSWKVSARTSSGRHITDAASECFTSLALAKGYAAQLHERIAERCFSA